MGKNASRRKAKAYEDIARLRANRRKDCIKCAAALAALAGLAAGGVLTPGMAVCLVIAGAALVALGVHLDKERQRWGGSVNPPLPPQR